MLKNKFLLLAVCCLGFLTRGQGAFAEEDFVYEDGGRRDPFIAIVTPDGRFINLDKKESGSELNVEGIIYDDAGISYAIVNEKVAQIGDFIGEYRVIKIKEKSVIFAREGQMLEFSLKEEELDEELDE